MLRTLRPDYRWMVFLTFIKYMTICNFMCFSWHFPVLQVKSFSTTYYEDVMIWIIDEDDWMMKYSWSEWHRLHLTLNIPRFLMYFVFYRQVSPSYESLKKKIIRRKNYGYGSQRSKCSFELFLMRIIILISYVSLWLYAMYWGLIYLRWQAWPCCHQKGAPTELGTNKTITMLFICPYKSL